MFETGMEFVRVDFHLHTRQDKEFKYEGSDKKNEHKYAEEYIERLKAEGIKCGVITNHNKFNNHEYKNLKKMAMKQNIFILPGVELSIKEGANGIHTLIIFNPDEWITSDTDYINNFLTSVFLGIGNPENKNAKCKYDLAQILEQLEKLGKDYFIVFAHVDQDSGLLKECDGGVLKTYSDSPSFKRRVLGLQKSISYDRRNTFSNCFGYLPALVEGSDPKSMSEIGKGARKTYLKIGEYSFAAIKFALLDHKNRVRTSIPDVGHGYIQSISIEGGKLDKLELNLSPQLNTLIGIRGSGKSSILEILRYALDLPVQVDSDYKNSLVDTMLGSGGKVTLRVLDKHGKPCTISRILKEPPRVFDENGMALNISPLSLFNGIQYFGQKDLSSSTNHENELLEKLTSGKVNQNLGLEEVTSELERLVRLLLDREKIPSDIEDSERKLSEIDYKMKIYEEKGVSEKLKKQTAFSEDKEKLELIKDRLNRMLKQLKSFQADNMDFAGDFYSYKSLHNEDIFKEVSDLLSSTSQDLASIQSIIDHFESILKDISEKLSTLNARMTDLSDEFAEIKREIKDDTLDVDYYMTASEERRYLDNKINELKKAYETVESLKSSFISKTQERDDMLRTQFIAYEDEATKLNEKQSELVINIFFKGNKTDFKSQLITDFKGTTIKDAKYQQIVDHFTDYVSLIEDWIVQDGKWLKSLLGSIEYSNFDRRLRKIYPELLRRQTKNKVVIYYHGKPLKVHSIGQRASALILFILSQNNNDVIIIDQPEDDLDNKVIYDEVIKALVNSKDYLQFIFATHNANIPVLGDAERVLATEYDDSSISVTPGNIDAEVTHQQIINIMEGGKEAFNKRHTIYTCWR